MKNLLCPKCHKLSRSPHLKSCFSGSSKDEANLQCLLSTWPQLRDARQVLEDQQSVLAAIKELNVPYSRFQDFARLTGIKIPSIKDTARSPAVKKRMKETFNTKYGADNPLSRGTTAFEKRNRTIKKKYGVNNIFQLEHIKNKITLSHLERYGVKRKTNIEAARLSKMAWTDEQRYAIGRKIAEYKRTNPPKRNGEKAFNWKSLSIPNRLESKVAQALTDLGIGFEFSFWIAGRQFDFRIGDVIIEIQGDFWHANPKFYSESHELSFPGNVKVTAGDLWKKDHRKKVLAESRGYTVLYVWESDIRNCKNLKDFIVHLLEQSHLLQ